MKDLRNGTWKTAETEVIDFLHQVWEMLEQGRIHTLLPEFNGTYDHLLTQEVIEGMLKGVDVEVLESEIRNFPGYHYPQQCVKPEEVELVPLGLLELPETQQFAIAQTLAEILYRYDARSERELEELRRKAV